MRLLIALLLFPAIFANAASHHVRGGLANNGDGTTWAEAASPGGVGAFNALPATLTRGDTYFIADYASYPAYTFNDAPSSTTLITIKKATVADHGTSTGWDNTYGDGQAVWSVTSTGWTIDTTYMVFDGVTGSGFGTTAYGFKIAVSSIGGVGIWSSALVDTSLDCRNITFQNIEIDLPQSLPDSDYTYGFYLSGDVAPHTKDISTITISNVWIKKGRQAITAGYAVDWIVERCSIEAQGPGDVDHHYAQLVFSLDYSNITIRYNQIRDAQQEGWTSVIEPQAYPGSNMYIYGNAFYARTGLAYNSFCNEGIFVCAGEVHCDGLYIFNNTIYGWQGGNAGIFLDTGAGVSANVFIRNNIWVDCAAAGISDPNAVAVTSNNDTSATVTFVDAATYNFHLTAHEGPGTTLASPFDTDPDGTTRGAGGTWDRGMFQLASSPSGGAPSAYGVTARVGSIRQP